MSLKELINHFKNLNIWININTPVLIKYGMIKDILRENDSALLESMVDRWIFSESNVLEVEI